MSTGGSNNPGLESGDELTSTQETLLKSIANLSFSNGDVLYYNNSAFQRLAVGSNTNVLNLSSGIPSWIADANRNTFTAYAAGTAYSLTNTAALADFGTTDPAITITTAGTYLIFARAVLDYNGATFAAVRTATVKLRRTNNTAADLTNASSALKTQVITALTFTAGDVILPPVIYTTTNTDDIIQMWAGLDTAPTAGSMDVSSAEIVAVRLY